MITIAMNLNEFITLYRKALEDTPGVAKILAHKLGEEIRRMNQPVLIRDLVAKTVPEYSFGEAKKHINQYLEPAIDRLKAHIKMLFDLANADHCYNYCYQDAEGSYKIRPIYNNCVTRLSTPEFAFYTHEAPISIQEFSELCQTIVTNFHLKENVLVLLSSFAVVDKDGPLLNLSIFVEGGTPPVLHVFSKNFASNVDIDYWPFSVFSQDDISKEDLDESSPSKDGISLSTGSMIYTGSVFEVRTIGGARFTQVTDICMDHLRGHGKRQIMDRIYGNSCEYNLLPEQVEYCISSNILARITQDSLVSDWVLHTDPVTSSPVVIPNIYVHKPGCYVSFAPSEWLANFIKVTALTEINSSKNGYVISAPSFGSDLTVAVFSPRPVGQFKEDILSHVRQHNYAILGKRLHLLQMDSSLTEQEIPKILFDNFVDKLLYHFNGLQQVLLQLCEPTTMEWVHLPEEFLVKFMASQIIKEAMEAMAASLNEDGCGAIETIDKWRKDLDKSLDEISPPGMSHFISQLKSEITRTLDVYLAEDLSRDYSQGMSI